MSHQESTAHGPLAEATGAVERSERRAALLVRSVFAALALALSTIVGVLLAVLALAPAALRRGPIGRRVAAIGRTRSAAGPKSAARAARRAEQALPR